MADPPTHPDSARALTDADLDRLDRYAALIRDDGVVGVRKVELVALIAEVRRLRAAIRDHRDVRRDLGVLDQYGSDFDLWAVLDDGGDNA